MKLNMFGYYEFESKEEYENHFKEYDRIKKELSKLTRQYNDLVDDYNNLKKNSKLQVNKIDSDFQSLLSKATEQDKVIKSLRSENTELLDEVKRLQSRQLNDYELELQNAKTLEEVETLKAKHKEIMKHRKMTKMVQARGETHEY